MFYKKIIINDAEYNLAVNITGSGAPTAETEADVGMFYMDADTGNVYKLTADGWLSSDGTNWWVATIASNNSTTLSAAYLIPIEGRNLIVGDLILYTDGVVKVITAVSGSGNSAAVEDTGICLKGEQGEPGEDGYTPERGVDYWTAEDVETINSVNRSYINEKIAEKAELKPEFAETIDNCTDTTKLYVLPDGYVYAYYTKLVEEAVNQLVGNTVTLNRTSTSMNNGCFVTDWIEMKWGDGEVYQINIKGSQLLPIYTSGVAAIVAFSNDASTKTKELSFSEIVEGDGCDTITINLDSNEIGDKPLYMKISVRISNDSLPVGYDVASDVFIECPTLNIADEVTGWYNTEKAFTPVKGVHYFTDEDKSSIVAEVLAALPNASGVSFG